MPRAGHCTPGAIVLLNISSLIRAAAAAAAASVVEPLFGLYCVVRRYFKLSLCVVRCRSAGFSSTPSAPYFNQLLAPRSIPISIRNFFNLAAPGTVIGEFITQEDEAGGQFVKGFATIDDVALINVEVRANPWAVLDH